MLFDCALVAWQLALSFVRPRIQLNLANSIQEESWQSEDESYDPPVIGEVAPGGVSNLGLPTAGVVSKKGIVTSLPARDRCGLRSGVVNCNCRRSERPPRKELALQYNVSPLCTTLGSHRSKYISAPGRSRVSKITDIMRFSDWPRDAR